MRLYYEIGVRSFRRMTQYRSAYIAGALTNAFFGAIRSFVYIALYASGSVVAGYTLDDMLSYTWATQALLSIGAGWVPMDVANSIRTGDVITDMARPWSFYGYWFSRSVGERLSTLALRGGLTYLIGILYFGAVIPPVNLLLPFTLSIAFALVISFAFSFMINLTAFWLLEITGVVLIANTLQAFLSGFMLPIAFLPPWMQALANILPFQGIVSLPTQILLGKLDTWGIGAALLNQLTWSILMTLLAWFVMRAAVQKVVVQGG